MKLSNTSSRQLCALLAIVLVGSNLFAADGPATGTGASQNEEIARLQTALAAQQKQLEALQKMMEQQQKLLENAVAQTGTPSGVLATSPALRPNLGSVASIAPILPVPAKAMPAVPFPAPQAAATMPSASKNPCEAPPDTNAVPAYLRLGSTCIIPVGFMDFTSIWRDKNAASGIATNFGSIPFNNVAAGKLSELRFSPQNSRLGFRAEGDWKGAHFMAYNEFDFNGTSGGNNLGVSNGSFVPRLRLFWVDIRKDKLEILAGQSWTLLTPNRKGLSALPGDLFFSQVIDLNYMTGLTWNRQPGIRVLYHPNSTVTAGVSLENPDQYIGGSGGLNAGAVVLPAAAALSGIGGAQVDNASNVLNTPNLHPDIIGKIAFDPSSKFHFEVGGIERTFKIWDSATNTYSTKVGGGALLGANVEVVKNLRLISTNFWSDGGGRYLFGQAPDFVVRADGTISPVHAGGTVDGFEATVNKTLFYAYFGGIFIEKNTALDANGTTKIGYGFANSSSNDNRLLQEITFGFNQTIWKDPRYGAINVMGQYQWQNRDPWAVLVNQPKAAHDSSIWMNLRYTLPGSMPNF